MNLKELKSNLLTKEILQKHIDNNIINFDFYGISNDLLFIINNDKMAVFNYNESRFIIPYTKGILIPFKEIDTGNKVISSLRNDKIKKVFFNGKNLEVDLYHDTCNYTRFDEFGRYKLAKDKYYLCSNDSIFKPDVRYFFKKANGYGGLENKFIDETNLKYDDEFDNIYSSDILSKFKIQDNDNNYPSNILKSNDKWEAQSEYKYGLSIIYKNGLYGICDVNHNIMFDYNESITYIKIISHDTILLKNKDNLSSIYNFNLGYIVPFKYSYDDVIMLDNDIFKVYYEGNYRYIINGEISNQEYNNISYDREILIMYLNEDKTIFMNRDKNILFELNTNKFYKSSCDIYYKRNNDIIRHNLYDSKESIIKNNVIYDKEGVLDSSNIDSLLEQYKYYYIDENGKMTLLKTMKYGISIGENGIEVQKWYDNLKDVYEFEKEFLNNLVDISCDNINRKNKQKVYKNTSSRI